MRAIRCFDCGSRFYTSPEAPRNTCQDCANDYDPIPQAKADAAVAKAVNSRVKNGKQSYDPRNPKTLKEKP
jgi:predicted  nucleic acid-binding Zn-ribbon protein